METFCIFLVSWVFLKNNTLTTPWQDDYKIGFVLSQDKTKHVKIPHRNTKQRSASSGKYPWGHHAGNQAQQRAG
ncbi:MAG: hypothetical protein RLZZ46_1205 [Bacteroidota bacterium]|jgi:hypothetical protein